MAILLKPRSNSQGVVDTTADLAQLNGRPGYQVLVKDVALFEWVVSGVVDNDNIFPALSGFWSKVLMSGDITLAFTAEDSANKSLNVITDAASDVKYPSVKATKTYADSLVTGLLDDRGNFTPGGTSPGAWPTTGGSGTAGAIMKGDIWFCSASGFMGTTAVVAGASFRAVVDTPGQTDANWNVLSAGAISTSIPSLSQVTVSGAITSTDITVLSSAASRNIKAQSSGADGGAFIGYSNTNKGYVVIDNGGNWAIMRANNLTNDRTFQFPDTDGTLALTSQIVEPYKVYTASLVFAPGDSVTATVYRNTIGDGSGDGINDIQFTRSGGTISADMTGSTAFPAGKTWIQPSSYASGLTTPINLYGSRISNTKINYYSLKTSDNTSVVANGPAVFIEIRVYP